VSLEDLLRLLKSSHRLGKPGLTWRIGETMESSEND
jgi:hypothetical protein